MVEILAKTQKTVKMQFSVILSEMLPKDTTNYFYYQVRQSDDIEENMTCFGRAV